MASTFTSRYQETINGAITFTGNTVGLSKKENSNQAGIEHSIGGYISPNAASSYEDYVELPPTITKSGTTQYITENPVGANNGNGSFAYLNLPSGSKIEYADLIWAGSYQVGVNNVSAPIKFTVGANSNTITTQDAQYTQPNKENYYLNVKEVTNLLPSGTIGGSQIKITCENIIGTITTNDNTGNACGWTLCVIYSNPALPSRNISLYSGNLDTFVASNNTVTATASGFQTPISGLVNGRILFTALEGDATLTGDQAAITNTSGTFNDLFGPKNLSNNFFASQINNDFGNTDTSGSFGNNNQNPSGTNIVGGRQGWDITNVNANPSPFINLDNGQTSTTVRCTSSGDRYWVTGLGIQLDVNSPAISATKTVNKTTVVVGEEMEYTVTLTNNGTADAFNIVIDDDIPAYTTYVPASAQIVGGTGITTTFPTIITITSVLAPKQSVSIKYRVTADSVPPSRTFINFSDITYKFYGPDSKILTGIAQTNSVLTSILAPVPPVVPNYTVDTCKNGSTSGTVVGIDIEGHYPLKFLIYTNPNNGFASINLNSGIWIYTPKVGFVGTDSFVVEILDSEGAASYSTITINVLDIPCCELRCNQCQCNRS